MVEREHGGEGDDSRDGSGLTRATRSCISLACTSWPASWRRKIWLDEPTGRVVETSVDDDAAALTLPELNGSDWGCDDNECDAGAPDPTAVEASESALAFVSIGSAFGIDEAGEPSLSPAQDVFCRAPMSLCRSAKH